ncbi:MAG: N-acetylgalactosamine-6-sulfatase [Verrucomicrobia bacterium]|nr:N-acetylgalactosamine-6-sulfatase [Verrucomicrobiota bacterium]
MSRHPLLLLILWSACLFGESRPNIVFILADDLGYGEVGYNGQKIIRTPNVDRLAREGMIFTRHYCGNAVCSPSRTVLMTGRNPGHATTRDNRDVGDQEQFPLPAGITTLPAFDHFLGITSQWVAHSHYPPFIQDDGKKIPLDNGPGGTPGHANFPADADPKDPKAFAAYIGKDFSSDHTIAGAEAFIADNKGKPFFLYYASPLPHVSLQVPAEELKQYDGVITEDAPYVPTKGGYVPNRTPRIIVFSGDNGATHDAGGVDTKYFNSVGDLKGLKGSLHEGGVREPTVVRWPAGIKAGSRSNRISGFEDWLATFAELAGAKLERDADMSSESLVPALKGTDAPRAQPLYREFPGYGSQQAIWDGKWKAIRTDMAKTVKAKGQIHTELYDLDADPNETTDLADKFPDILKGLETKMSAARVPDSNFPLIGVDPTPANTGKGKKKAAAK